MGERVYPVGVPCWVDIETPQPRFYTELFGWELAEVAPGYRVARLRGGDVAGFGPPAAGTGWHTYVRVGSADRSAAAVRAAGGTVIREPYELPGLGVRVAACADPAGATFRLWEPPGDGGGGGGADRVNEPGSWNFSGLNTDDPVGAEAFYAAVFGWQARPVDLGAGSATMWCVPGYGDVQDAWAPGFRRRHEEGGSPDGFVDAVAWMEPLAGGEAPGGGVPHWSITFAVADAGASAEAAARLGGEVLVPPFAAGGARLAVLRDPQGAVLTVTAWSGE